MRQLKKILILAATMQFSFLDLEAVEPDFCGNYASMFLTTGSNNVSVNPGENVLFNSQATLSGIEYNNSTGVFTLDPGTYAVTYFFAPFTIPAVNMYANDQLILNSPLGGNSTVLTFTESENTLTLQYISALTFTPPGANQSWASISISQIATLPFPAPSLLIPTTHLSGNNLTFANYINKFAPADAVYFIPAELDGSLNAALQSAAPTRNAASIYTASNTLFDLTTSFANHIRLQQLNRRLPQKKSGTVAANEIPSEELLASREANQDLAFRRRKSNGEVSIFSSRKDSIWFEAIGAWAFQKSQHQTVGFDPTTGGTILAYDREILPELRMGGGISYLFTHIHENKGQGHSNINQEDGFIYSSWDNQTFYVDLLLMGGGVQIDQVRNITMTGFSFRSSSHPKGWQLLPHLELGYKQNATSLFNYNPFVMLDWANAWQESYKEHGHSPFNAAQKSYYGSLLRTEAGFRFFETLHFDSWNFIFEEKLSYVNTHSFNAGKVSAFLVGSPGSFTVETLSSSQNLGIAQVAMTFDPFNASYPMSTLFYQGEFGPQYQSHQLNIELSWQF